MKFTGLQALRATPSCTLQQVLDEEKSKHASLAQQNGFGPAFFGRGN
jgi:hypothetical protein